MNDICASKHGGNQESKAAFERGKASHSKQRESVYNTIKTRPKTGFTCREICARLDLEMNVASARMAELKKAKRLESTGVRRGGGLAFKAKEAG